MPEAPAQVRSPCGWLRPDQDALHDPWNPDQGQQRPLVLARLTRAEPIEGLRDLADHDTLAERPLRLSASRPETPPREAPAIRSCSNMKLHGTNVCTGLQPRRGLIGSPLPVFGCDRGDRRHTRGHRGLAHLLP